jgi:hypothetical protein
MTDQLNCIHCGHIFEPMNASSRPRCPRCQNPFDLPLQKFPGSKSWTDNDRELILLCLWIISFTAFKVANRITEIFIVTGVAAIVYLCLKIPGGAGRKAGKGFVRPPIPSHPKVKLKAHAWATTLATGEALVTGGKVMMGFYLRKPARIISTILLLAFVAYLLGERPKKGLSIVNPFEFAEFALISASQLLLVLGCLGISIIPSLWVFELARRFNKGMAGRWTAAAAFYVLLMITILVAIQHVREGESLRRENEAALNRALRDMDRDFEMVRPILQRMKREAETGNVDKFRLAYREAVLLVPSFRIPSIDTNTWSPVDPEIQIRDLYKRETGRDEESAMFVLLTGPEAKALKAVETVYLNRPDPVPPESRWQSSQGTQDVRQILWDKISAHARRMDAEFRVQSRGGFAFEYREAVRDAKNLGAFDPDRYVQQVYFKITGRSALDYLKSTY